MSKIIMKSNICENLIFITDETIPAPGMVVKVEGKKYVIVSIDIHDNFLNLKEINLAEIFITWKQDPITLLPDLVSYVIKQLFLNIITKTLRS